MVLDFDLNVPASEDNGDQIGTSGFADLQESQATQHEEPLPAPAIEEEDEVIFSSPRAFEEAKLNSRRHGRKAVVHDVDALYEEEQPNPNNSMRSPPNQTAINYEHYANLESSCNAESTDQHSVKFWNFLSPWPESPPPPPPRSPSPPPPPITCPICLGGFVEEISTKCGHIFCKACITSALAVQNTCPTCRKRVDGKDIIRIYLPLTSTKITGGKPPAS